ncbi:MAG TPA: hypothetical protein PKZ29_00525 [Candidatus Woesebacteria bacterium]|nr:hypothetical protein [Candidatus Woesebacteria bacterium]HOG37388.1 hypothetical protein [Candidatus Woesebacteria bacterium]
MEGNSFWLIYIQNDRVSVSLISAFDNKYRVLATGPSKSWTSDNPDTLTTAVDESLSVASLNANITEEQEPGSAAIVVPPFWVSNDGKILPSKVKSIKETCKSLSLTPTGFLAEDDAIVEDANQSDGFPASFILVHLSDKDFYLSLVYLGHIKERIKKDLLQEFTSQDLESALLEINSESALPPQILVFGQFDARILSSLKNYPWVGKKNVETFLHLPEIKSYDQNQIIDIFTRVISGQLDSSSFSPKISDTPDDNSKADPPPADTKPEPEPEITAVAQKLTLTETSPEDLGFSSSDSTPAPASTPTLPIITPADIPPQDNPPSFSTPSPPIEPPPSQKPKFSFDFFKKFKLPQIKFNKNFLWLGLIFIPILAVLPFFILKTDVTVFVVPYKFDKSLPVTLKVGADNNDISSSIIPVNKETFDIKAEVSIKTTGQKTVGNKSQGEITIFNKLDKPQSLPKGAVITDPDGKKFELTTAVSVAASSSNLEEGVIKLGQTKTVAVAADIGSEYNIPAGSQLKFKDFPETSLIAKTESAFAGGSRQQIAAVSAEDKTTVQSRINEEITNKIEEKINQTTGSVSGLIKETIQSQKDSLELSREVGEAAEDLAGTITASVSVFVLDNNTRDSVIRQFLSSESDFANSLFDPKDYTFSLKVNKIETNQASGNLTVSGQSLPKIDQSNLKKALTFKTLKSGGETIKKIIPRAYNFNIKTKLPLLSFTPNHINIEVKTETK